MITIIIQDKTMTIQDEERKTYDIHRKQKRNIKLKKEKQRQKMIVLFFFIPIHLTCVPVLNDGSCHCRKSGNPSERFLAGCTN